MAQPKISGGKDTLLRPHAITDGPGHEERDPRNKTGGLGTEPGVGESGGPSTMGTGWLLCPERGGGGPSPHTDPEDLRPRGGREREGERGGERERERERESVCVCV